MPAVLEGTRVLDLTSGPVGGVATAVLADFGADVVKIEPPRGDRFRALAAAPLWLRGKRSVALDLTIEADCARLAPLVASADVLVVSGPPGRAARFGVDAERALAANPQLVHASLTPFGPRGPYAEIPGYEGIVAALGGRMAVFARQVRRDGPGFAAVSIASHACAMGVVQGVVAALYARERTGRGQRVESSLLQALLPYDLVSLLLVQLAAREGKPPPDPYAVGGDMPTLNYHPILTQDGRWLQCGNLLEHLFLSFLDSIDLLGELLAEERFAAPPGAWDAATIEAARDRILLRVLERTADEWMQRFHANGNVAAEPYLTPTQALAHPDLVANGSVVTLRDPERGDVKQVGPIARLVATPARIAKPAPRVGEHGREVLAEQRSLPPRVVTGDTPPGQPLAGVTILELATIIAAPLGTTFLADLGARVIKIEAIDGDPYRQFLTRGLLAVKTNAGKESICLDLKSADGRAIAHDLVRRVDVLVHNYRPGVPERLGIDYASARALNPQLIWVSANGYGPDGPSARRPVTHPVAGAAAGGAGHQGAPTLARAHETLAEIREGARQLMRANEANPDPNTSVVLAAAIALGLLARQRFGIAQPIYTDMFSANAWANADDFLDYAGKPARPRVDDALLGFAPTYRLYETREGWVFLALTCDAEWRRFCAMAERESLGSDPRFASEAARAQNADALVREIGTALKARGAAEWQQRALAARVPLVRADATDPGHLWAHDAHVRENGFVQPCRHARFGDVLRWGALVTVNGAAERYGAGALAGDCTDALLRELGRSDTEIARLREQRVVASEPIAG
ncbi:MAG: CoA transferase [Deltaproteobacteria bacterium]|nr:CoA transferase [Deltaproteobacteria bacterium]